MAEQILAGKTCLVTGGAGGLGKAIATHFLGAGANVVICDINEERLQQAAAELSSKGPLRAIKSNITNLNEVQSLFDELIREFGKIDVLVNNAGIMDHFDPVGDLDVEQWERVMALNLTAPMILSKMAVRNMLEQPMPDGRIINIVSVAGRAGWAAGVSSTLFTHVADIHSDLNTTRCRLYCQQAWPCRIDQEHRCVLWQQGHPLQRHDDGCHEYQHCRCVQDRHAHGGLSEDELRLRVYPGSSLRPG